MIEINKELLDSLFVQAESSDRKRINHDLRTSLNDGGQRMLNAMLRSTIVPIHRHPMSNENVILLVGKMDEVFRFHPHHTCHPCVIYEAKDGKYGNVLGIP